MHPFGSRNPHARNTARSASTLVAAAVLAPTGATVQAQGQQSGNYRAIPIDSSLQNTLANAQGQLTFHTYTIDIPAGLHRLVVEIDGLGNDIDLAGSSCRR